MEDDVGWWMMEENDGQWTMSIKIDDGDERIKRAG